MVNTDKLKGLIVEKKTSQPKLAKKLGIAPATMNQKIHNKRPMLLEEALKLQELLEISDADFRIYFFAEKLHSATKRGS
ncbi:MAG: DUF739 family protein [Clostridia bacterium]|nr:DUF739 family protein [Clostridia bacterium]